MEQQNYQNNLKKSKQLRFVSALFLLVVVVVAGIVLAKQMEAAESAEEVELVQTPLQENPSPSAEKSVSPSLKQENLRKANLLAKKREPEPTLEKKVSEKKPGKKKSKKKKKDEKLAKDTLVIGDSLAYAMSLKNRYVGATKAENFYWLTEGGVGAAFLKENLKITTGRTMPKAVHNTLTMTSEIDLVKEVKEKGIKNIVVLLGINSSSEADSERLMKRLLLIEEKTTCQVFYISILPMVDYKAEQNGYGTRDAVNVNFNRLMKKKIKDTNLTYIDAYNAVKSLKNYESKTGDGIHYSRAVYDRVIEEMEKEIAAKEKEIKAMKLKEKKKEEEGLETEEMIESGLTPPQIAP